MAVARWSRLGQSPAGGGADAPSYAPRPDPSLPMLGIRESRRQSPKANVPRGIGPTSSTAMSTSDPAPPGRGVTEGWGGEGGRGGGAEGGGPGVSPLRSPEDVESRGERDGACFSVWMTALWPPTPLGSDAS